MRRTDRESEFSEFFLARAPAMRRTAYVIVRDWHTADDVVQQTFIKLYVSWGRIKREGLDGYARRTVVTTALSELRKNRREVVSETPSENAAASSPAEDTSSVELIAQLPPRQRAVIALRFLDDLSVADVAHMLDISEGTVKSQTARALETLRNKPAATTATRGYS